MYISWDGWDLAECGWDIDESCRMLMRSSQVWMRSNRLCMRSSRVWMSCRRGWMRSSRVWLNSIRVVRVSGCQFQRRNSPGIDLSILRHNGIWEAADAIAVLKKVHPKAQKNSLMIYPKRWACPAWPAWCACPAACQLPRLQMTLLGPWDWPFVSYPVTTVKARICAMFLVSYRDWVPRQISVLKSYKNYISSCCTCANSFQIFSGLV
jgi:hypothetical protein